MSVIQARLSLESEIPAREYAPCKHGCQAILVSASVRRPIAVRPTSYLFCGAGNLAQYHILFSEPGIRQELWGRLATCGGLVTRPNRL